MSGCFTPEMRLVVQSTHERLLNKDGPITNIMQGFFCLTHCMDLVGAAPPDVFLVLELLVQILWVFRTS